jgi:predicted patatin/cPLA2 family phospholipase
MREDAHKLAVVIEGGGMRAACSGGMVGALEQLGMRDCVDVVYGASAGALNAAYFLSRQAVMGCSIYVEDLPSLRFINPYRMALPFGHRPVVDMEYAIDHIYQHVKPLDIEAVLKSDIPLHVTATDVATGELEDFVGAETWESLRLWLLASTRVPMLAGNPVAVDGGLYIDATLSDGVPYHLALAHGATHILVLRSRRNDRGASFSSPIERWFMEGALRRIDPGLGHVLASRASRAQEVGRELSDLTATGDGPPYICAIEPPAGMVPVHQLSRNRDLARQAVNAGHRAVVEALGVRYDVDRSTLKLRRV